MQHTPYKQNHQLQQAMARGGSGGLEAAGEGASELPYGHGDAYRELLEVHTACRQDDMCVEVICAAMRGTRKSNGWRSAGGDSSTAPGCFFVFRRRLSVFGRQHIKLWCILCIQRGNATIFQVIEREMVAKYFKYFGLSCARSVHKESPCSKPPPPNKETVPFVVRSSGHINHPVPPVLGTV